MIKCKNCGETILSDKPIRCPFCGINYEEPKTNICPTCGAGFTGMECPHCGDELNDYDDSSFYQNYIAEHNSKEKL